MAAPAAHDLRLAWAACGGWAADLLVVETLGPRRGAMLAAGAAAGAALGLVGSRRGGARRRLVLRAAGVLAAAAALASLASVRVARVHATGLAAVAGSGPGGGTVALRLAVATDPVLAASTVNGHRLASVHVAGRVVAGACAGCRGQLVLVLAPDQPAWRSLVPSQVVEVSGTVRAAAAASPYSAMLVVRSGPGPPSPPSTVQRVAARIRLALRTVCASAPGPAAGLLPGLVDGDTSGLDETVTGDFRAAGMTHLVAVSGENVALALAAALGLARLLGAGRRSVLPIGLLVLVALVILARPGPSVLRAAVTAAVALVARAAGRPGSALPLLAAAVLVLLARDPYLAGNRGFQLSVAATAGIVLMAHRIQHALERRLPFGLGPPLGAALGVPAAAQLACAPVIASFAGQVSLVAIPANAAAAPAVGPATVAGIAAAGLGPVVPPLGHLAAWIGGWPALWLVGVAHVAAAVPLAVVAWPVGLGGGVLLAAVTAVGWALLAPRPVADPGRSHEVDVAGRAPRGRRPRPPRGVSGLPP